MFNSQSLTSESNDEVIELVTQPSRYDMIKKIVCRQKKFDFSCMRDRKSVV